MSYHDTDLTELFSDRNHQRSKKSSSAEVEVILLAHSEDSLRVKSDEDAPPRWIPRKGIKIASQNKGYAVLQMTEKRAIDLNLA